MSETGPSHWSETPTILMRVVPPHAVGLAAGRDAAGLGERRGVDRDELSVHCGGEDAN